MNSENMTINGKTLTDDQQRVVDEESDGELINVTGYAGSGKTFTLLGKIIKYAQKTDDSLIYLVYTNKMADNIREILHRLGISDTRVVVKTMDSFSKEVYRNACPHQKMKLVMDEDRGPWMEKARDEAKRRAEILGYAWSSRLNDMTIWDWLDECSWMANMGVPVDKNGIDVLMELERSNRAKINYSTDSDRETAFYVYQTYTHILRNRGDVSRENRYEVGYCIPEYFSLQALQYVD